MEFEDQEVLSAEDINYILKTVSHHFFRMGVIGMFANGNPLNPAFISSKGIIFIYGNKHLGVIHINDRHGYFSNRSDWTKDRLSGRIFPDNPSKYPKNSLPIDDYRQIADDIYVPSNKVQCDNEAFDMYTGISTQIEGREMAFNMLLYRGTKIVHTVYPKQKTYNRIKKTSLNLKKRDLTVTTTPLEEVLIASLPYTDINDIIRFVIFVKLDNRTKVREIWVEMTTPEGWPMYCERIQQVHDQPKMAPEAFYKGLEFADYSAIEKKIKKFDEELSDISDTFRKKIQNDNENEN
jgi:hypothetical protein